MVVREYTTMDKSTWPPGPWMSEPDKVQWKDEETGYACLVVRNSVGAWCGYVGLNPDHPLYEKHYSDMYDTHNFHVHGGLTYSDHCMEGPEDEAICHIPDPGEPDHVWWLGFDCAHAYDLCPGNRHIIAIEGDVYRDLEYVKNEVTSLAQQLSPHLVDATTGESNGERES